MALKNTDLIAIVSAGICGLSTALRLAHRGLCETTTRSVILMQTPRSPPLFGTSRFEGLSILAGQKATVLLLASMGFCLPTSAG
ncbi:hypothetical protein KEM54_000081 [Ascosphaera aggregata]|nr:hypothetical protein KEM54_000081 [Ascosphaera aggregata]